MKKSIFKICPAKGKLDYKKKCDVKNVIFRNPKELTTISGIVLEHIISQKKAS